MFQIADTNFVHAPNRVPLVFVDVNAVPGSLVTSNGIRVRAATLSLQKLCPSHAFQVVGHIYLCWTLMSEE